MQYTEGYLLDNRYQLERFIGSGSFGEVWVATDKATDMEVATKIYVAMDESGLQDFKKEFQLTFELNHSNLLHSNYLGVNPEDRRPFLVMPFCPEGAVTKFAGSMTEEELWRFVRDVSSGLAYLHGLKPAIIHQDIKPDNILIQKNGDFVISDFGISKQLRASLRKSAMSLNSAGAISYMGPERFSKQFQAVKASDIWSLGASLYELATGELPFCGMGGSLQKKGADIPELPEEFSPDLNLVLQACLAKEPWNRPTAAQLFEFADRFIKGENPAPTWHKKQAVSPEAEQEGMPNQPVQQLVEQPVQQVEQQPVQQPYAQAYQQPAPPQQTYPQQNPVGQPSPYPQQLYGQQYPVNQPGFISGDPVAGKSAETIPGWLWALIAIVGLGVGYLVYLVV